WPIFSCQPCQGSFILAFSQRNGTDLQQPDTCSLKMRFRSKRISAILWKTSDGDLQTERKLSPSFGIVVLTAFRSARKGWY
uniref:Uncharacterized protein n=1 Tax=Romanomermis culicivorax TaxID=13658 RepID=A0A915J5G1_ROMCU